MIDRPLYYLLDEQGNPYPTNDRDAVENLLIDVKKRRIGFDERNIAGHHIRVSTVFLVFDHNLAFNRDTPPVLYETMLFIDKDDVSGATQRYHTRQEAQAGHQEIVEKMERVLMQMGHLNIDATQIVGLLTSRDDNN